MDAERTWALVAQERRALADLLRGLSPEQWHEPSLCDGWTVLDTAAHASAWPDTRARQALLALLQAGGSYNGTNRVLTRKRARRGPAAVVDDLERMADSRTRPPVVGPSQALIDIMVHTQDIAIPLGIRHDMPVDGASHCADVCWRMSFPFGVRRRLSGYRLEATDTDWAAGDGVLVRGPIAALLLLITGRDAALERLSGEGAARLQHT